MLKQNPKGSWKKVKEIADKLLVRAKVQSELEVDRIKNLAEIQSLALELFHAMPLYDCLFYDSPLAPLKIRYHLKAFSKKMGLPGVSGILTPAVDIPDFLETIEAAVNWAKKFEKKDEKAS